MRDQLQRLTELLRDHRPLWETRPFVERDPAWEQAHPGVSAWLRGLGEDQLDALERDAELPADAPRELLRWDAAARAASEVPVAASTTLHLGPERDLARGVPGRKWRQVRAFVEAALPRLAELPAAPIVDWCAGKGHVSRLLALAADREVVAVERQGALCDAGAALAARVDAPVRFVTADVLGDAAASAALRPDVAVVALHACGDLSADLVRRGAAVRALLVVPCCYHRVGPESAVTYQPLSDAAQACELPLPRAALRLPTADDVAARPALRGARRRDMAFRLGLDLLVREASGEDAYRPLGRLPARVRRLPFEAFCREAARRLEIELPARWDPAIVERAGRERALVARQLGVVRARFRRPLELWLVLDRAMALAEAGRTVTVERFCPRAITPRNLLITAVSRGG